MQTFLPYPDFARSAACLDDRRLGKQRVEAKQVYLALTDPSYGWQNHPAVRMWRGCERALAVYGSIICTTWIERGFSDSLLPFFDHRCKYTQIALPSELPSWFGDPAFHLSHQSNLIRKDPLHYRPIFGDAVPSDLPYIWPKHEPYTQLPSMRLSHDGLAEWYDSHPNRCD